MLGFFPQINNIKVNIFNNQKHRIIGLKKDFHLKELSNQCAIIVTALEIPLQPRLLNPYKFDTSTSQRKAFFHTGHLLYQDDLGYIGI